MLKNPLASLNTACVIPQTCNSLQSMHIKCFTDSMVDNRFRLQEDPISHETKEIASKELRETPNVVEEALKKLRELLRNDDTLYFRDDDDMLMIFLRPTKFYPESALALMRRVAEFKEKNASLLKDLIPANEKQILMETNVVNVLVDRDQLGRRILVANVGGLWDTKKVSSDQLFRLFYLVHLAAMLEPETQVRGVVVILDFDKLSTKQVYAFSPTFSMRLLTFIQDAMPLRLKEVHIVKQPWLFNMVWQIFKPFVKDKLKKRLFFHGFEMSSLHKHLHPDYMPEDYGGKKPKINYTSADWYPTLSTLENHLKEWSTYGLVKSKKNK